MDLIVTCEECSTSFQLDEERIPASGAQVRCSRCKHAFFLANPSASQSEANHSIAEETAQDTMSGLPQAITDTPEAMEADPTAGEDLPDGEPDEEDWQFSEEIRHEDDEPLEEECEIEESDGLENELDADSLLDEDISAELDASELDASEVEDSAIDSVDLDSADALEIDDLAAESESESDPGLELDSASPELESDADESVFGSAEDFSSLTEEEDAPAVDLGGGSIEELEISDSGQETSSESAGAYSSGGATDDLGDPDSWDLVGNHDAAVSKVAIGAIGTLTQEDASSAEAALGDDSGSFEYDEEVGPASSFWQNFSRVGHGIGWALTIGFVAAAIGVALHSEWSRLIQAPQTVTAGPMTATTTTANWVETSRSGFILVVSGELRNTGSRPMRPGVVQLIMLDGDGQRIGEPPILAGERLPESVLREATPAQLMMSSAMAVSSLRETPLQPGQSRAFEAIALEADLPVDARRILLEIGDSAIAIAPRQLSQLDDPLGAQLGSQLDGPLDEESEFLP